MPKEESFPSPLKYIDVTRTNEQASQDLFYSTKGHLTEKHGLGRLTRKQTTTSRPDNVWPDMWKHMSDAAKSKAKQKWAIEKPKLDNARRLRGIFFIEPEDEEFKRMMKNARRKMKIPMPAAMPCRLQLHQHRETCGAVGQHKTKYACIVEADESMRIRMDWSQSKNREDHMAGRGMNSLNHYNLVHKFIPMHEAMKKDRCKGSSGKTWRTP